MLVVRCIQKLANEKQNHGNGNCDQFLSKDDLLDEYTCSAIKVKHSFKIPPHTILYSVEGGTGWCSDGGGVGVFLCNQGTCLINCKFVHKLRQFK